MNKKIFILFAVAAFAIASFTSCGKYPGYKKTDDGVYYKFHHKSGDTLMPREKSLLTLNIKYHTKIKGVDSLIFNSAHNPTPFVIGFHKTDVKGDIFSALALMHKGDSATFLLNAGTFFTKTVGQPTPPDIDSNGMIYFDIKMLDIQTPEMLQKKADEARAHESVIISDYVKANNFTSQPDTNGIYIVVEKEGTGAKLQNGMIGFVHLTISLANGKELFSTIEQQRDPIPFEYGKPFDTRGFGIITTDMKIGTKLKALIPSAFAFGDEGRRDMMNNEVVPAFSPIVYEIELMSAKTKAAYDKELADKKSKAEEDAKKAKTDEAAKISQYVKSNNISVTPTASGLYYIETQKGSGAKAEKGKKVQVNYKGYLFDGQVFDQSKGKPIEFMLGQGSVIRGWDEAISMMSEGGKAKLIIPSALAYGPDGSPGSLITPYCPLVFEVELVKVVQ